MFNGKMKAITFSYDDGVTQDQRLIKLFNKYGLKGTFNLNSGFLGNGGSLVREDVTVAHTKPRACEVKKIYSGHEVASHTLTHPMLTEMNKEQIIEQVENDRKALSDIVEYDVKGFAYPGGGVNYNSNVAKIIKENTGIKYCRTTVSSGNFDLQDNLYEFKPTIYHHAEWNKLFETGKRFLELETDTPKIFYIWGHAYEFDIYNQWDEFEEFCKLISQKHDIFYGTNSEVLLAE